MNYRKDPNTIQAGIDSLKGLITVYPYEFYFSCLVISFIIIRFVQSWLIEDKRTWKSIAFALFLSLFHIVSLFLSIMVGIIVSLIFAYEFLSDGGLDKYFKIKPPRWL